MYATNNKPTYISKGVDWLMVFLYTAIVIIGMVCIYAAVYKAGAPKNFTDFSGKNEYSKQLIFFVFSIFIATLILLIDSKFFPATANLFFLIGIFLMFLTLIIGHEIKGSKSWIPLGFFNLQPVELCKVFTSLALAKYLSSIDAKGMIDFKTQLIAGSIAFGNILLALAQHEMGLSLVYFAFFIPLYREGLPGIYILGFLGMILLLILFIILPKLILILVICVFVGLYIYSNRKLIARKRNALNPIIFLTGLSLLLSLVIFPLAMKKVLKEYQVTRIYNGFGKKNPFMTNEKIKESKTDDYNVVQSKIAIGSGGFTGQGFLKGTQTGGDFVPEQHTDFVFSSLGENFGFIGCITLLILYFGMLFRLLYIAERQRSTFTRVYAYCVASILFFHIIINILMAVGLAPVIGITLPLMSYGGSSLVTFTVLIFILIRLDADRHMVLR